MLYKNKEWLYQKYIIEKLTCKQIGELTNHHPRTIHSWLIRYDIPRRVGGFLGMPEEDKAGWIERRRKRDKDIEWRLRFPEKVKANALKYAPIIKEKVRLEKQKVLTHYGGGECACVRCGESRLTCLSIDHIHGGGSQHRKNRPKRFYKWLIDNNYPEGFQTLCMNCQWVKRFERNENKPRRW